SAFYLRQSLYKLFHIFTKCTADRNSLSIIHQNKIAARSHRMSEIYDKAAVTSAECRRQLSLKFIEFHAVNLLSRHRHHRCPTSALSGIQNGIRRDKRIFPAGTQGQQL